MPKNRKVLSLMTNRHKWLKWHNKKDLRKQNQRLNGKPVVGQQNQIWTNDAFFQDDDAICPVCRSDRYLTPNLKLLVSQSCYHKMCESCIDRLFSAGPAPCPECGQILRKNQFTAQIFEDLQVEKEVRIRKKIAKTFNKRLEDFSSLKAFNDYLEEVEDITWNLILGKDVEATQAKMKKYEQENQQVIAINEAKKTNEDKFAKYQKEMDKKERQMRRDLSLQEIEREKREKVEVKAEVIKALAESTSNRPAKEIHQEITLKRSSALIQSDTAKTTPQALDAYWRAQRDDFQEEETPDLIDPLALEYIKPELYVMQDHYYDQSTNALAANREARAGGYSVTFAYRRALDDAFGSLLLNPVTEDQLNQSSDKISV